MTELSKAATLDHVRRPDLPWRAATLTECGKPIAGLLQVIEREALLARLRDWGKARTSMVTCMTCWQTAARWRTFEQDPVDALRREVSGWRNNEQLAADLRALAALAREHRDQFDDYVNGLSEASDLAAARRRRLQGGRG